MLGRVEREGPCEGAAAGKYLLRAQIEEIVAPFDRRPESALSLWRIACAGGQERECAIEPLQQALTAQQTCAGSCQFDRERQAVEPGADGVDGLGLGVSSACRRGPGAEERGGVGRLERLEPVLVLAGKAQWRTARDQEAQTIREGEQLVQRRRRTLHMLEVVDEEQELATAHKSFEIPLGAHGLRDLRNDETRIDESSKRHPEHTVVEALDELGSNLQRKARLPDAAGAGDCDEPRVSNQLDELA